MTIRSLVQAPLACSLALVLVGGCYAKERDEALAEVARLKEELAKVQQTPENRLRVALEQKQEHWDDENALRGTVTNELDLLAKQYGSTPVGGSAREALGEVKERVAALEYARLDAERVAKRRQEEDRRAARQKQEEEERRRGKEVDYREFYAMARTGIQPGTYRFRAWFYPSRVMMAERDLGQLNLWAKLSVADDNRDWARRLMIKPDGWFTLVVSAIGGELTLLDAQEVK